MTSLQNHNPMDLNKINEALGRYSDKDWNYSRIILESSKLELLSSPYVLWIDLIDVSNPTKRKAFKTYEDEVTWGGRHSNELGILELISLRINRALIESTSDEHWENRRPIVRLVKKEDLIKQGITDAFWYRVTEVVGDDFDSR
jgi:hypothetical protein